MTSSLPELILKWHYISTVLAYISTLVSEKITTHGFSGCSIYAKQYFIQLYKYESVCHVLMVRHNGTTSHFAIKNITHV